LGVLASQLFQDDSVSSNEAAAATAKLMQERQRTTQLTTELTAARHNFEAQLQLSGDAIYEVTQLKKSVEAVTALLQQEREKTAELMRNLETAQSSIAACDAPDCVGKGPREPAVGAVAHPPTTEKKMDPELVRLMGRANELLAQGNINGARTALERAVEMGSARASFIIAETYDPRVLSGWKTFGTRGDLSKAREFYAKAAAGGIEEAKERLASLARN
jgi:TPR repeat protein